LTLIGLCGLSLKSSRQFPATPLSIGGNQMPLTNYHAQTFAYELTKRCPSNSPERFAGALVDAQAEINRRREQLIADIESRLVQKVRTESLFAIRWEIK